MLGSSLTFIDGSALGVALPSIQSDLGAGPAAAQWISNAYLLTLGALVLIGGAAGDRFGRRRVFLIGVGVFALSSIACGLAPTAQLLIAGRAVQGIGAALLTPGALALIGATFPEKERGAAFGTWAGAGALFGMVGPLVGGWLADNADWRFIFWINVAAGRADGGGGAEGGAREPRRGRQGAGLAGRAAGRERAGAP